MIVPVFLPHLGCTRRCIYCNQGYITGPEHPSLTYVIQETMNCVKGKGKFEVGLFGGNFFGIEKDKVLLIFEAFKPYMDRISNFRISTKPSAVDMDFIDILKNFKVTTVELGIPTFNDKILEVLNRGHDVNSLFSIYNLLKGFGFTVAIQVMVGLLHETWGDIENTSRAIAQLTPSYIRIYPLVVLKDTVLYDMYRDGSFTPIELMDAVERATYIYLGALKYGIPTVKMGLTEGEFVKKGIVAGPYHPAFGYLVKSCAFYLGLSSVLKKERITGDILVLLNRKDIPHLLGHRRSNIYELAARGIQIEWKAEEIKEGEFIIEKGLRRIKGSVFDGIDLLKEKRGGNKDVYRGSPK
ncbi:MAG: radical SAM protein [Syntrophorhabdaceae bacterium]|nr:radical SAM protein [Syntrophorhabdaceae bacterium]